MMPKAEKAND